jgi:hypothetical protein
MPSIITNSKSVQPTQVSPVSTDGHANELHSLASSLASLVGSVPKEMTLQALQFSWGGEQGENLSHDFCDKYDAQKEEYVKNFSEGTPEYNNACAEFNTAVQENLLKNITPECIKEKYKEIAEKKFSSHKEKQDAMQGLLKSHEAALKITEPLGDSSTTAKLSQLHCAWGGGTERGENHPAAQEFNDALRTQLAALLPPDHQKQYANDCIACKDLTDDDKEKAMIGNLQAMISDSVFNCTANFQIPIKVAIPPLPVPVPAQQPMPMQTAQTTTSQPLNPGSFSEEIKTHENLQKVGKSMETYKTVFAGYQGKAHATLLEKLEKKQASISKYVQSIKIYSNLSQEEAKKMAFERELVNIAMKCDLKDHNHEILGCEKSFASSGKNSEVVKPGNQVSIAMETPFLRADGEICTPTLLSVSAPALDTKDQPEWTHYVKTGPDGTLSLNEGNFRIALQTLSSHILQCAKDNPGKEVVLSAFGMMNFLTGLPEDQQRFAKTIGADEFAELVKLLRDGGHDVAFMGDSDDPFWANVNGRVPSEWQIKCHGRIPGEWMHDNQIIVNAWDPNSIIGNGCAKDNSLDGYIGRNSLCHDIHTLACAMHANELLPAPAVIAPPLPKTSNTGAVSAPKKPSISPPKNPFISEPLSKIEASNIARLPLAKQNAMNEVKSQLLDVVERYLTSWDGKNGGHDENTLMKKAEDLLKDYFDKGSIDKDAAEKLVHVSGPHRHTARHFVALDLARCIAKINHITDGENQDFSQIDKDFDGLRKTLLENYGGTSPYSSPFAISNPIVDSASTSQTSAITNIVNNIFDKYPKIDHKQKLEVLRYMWGGGWGNDSVVNQFCMDFEESKEKNGLGRELTDAIKTRLANDCFKGTDRGSQFVRSRYWEINNEENSFGISQYIENDSKDDQGKKIHQLRQHRMRQLIDEQLGTTISLSVSDQDSIQKIYSEREKRISEIQGSMTPEQKTAWATFEEKFLNPLISNPKNTYPNIDNPPLHILNFLWGATHYPSDKNLTAVCNKFDELRAQFDLPQNPKGVGGREFAEITRKYLENHKGRTQFSRYEKLANNILLNGNDGEDIPPGILSDAQIYDIRKKGMRKMFDENFKEY